MVSSFVAFCSSKYIFSIQSYLYLLSCLCITRTRINPSKQKTPALLSCLQVKPGSELSSYFQPSPLATTCYIHLRLSHNHKQLSAFIWSKLFTTSISDRIAAFLQKKTLGTSEKGFGIAKKRGTKWLF